VSNRWIKYSVVRWQPRLSFKEPKRFHSIVSNHKSYYAAKASLARCTRIGTYTVEAWRRK
jgi:hypothetical protein